MARRNGINPHVSVLVIACVSFVCASQAAYARLGETEAELEKRFGPPYFKQEPLIETEPGDKCLHYQKDGIQVMVMFWKGQSIREDYEFRGQIEGESLKKAAAIVEANANGQVLEQPANPRALNPNLKHGWNTVDGEMFAYIYVNSPDTLNIVSRSYMAERDRRTKAAKSGAGGF
jgi:hypothetical protein